MKLNKIMILFSLVLPFSLVLRFLQLYFTIEETTGFYLNETKNFGPVLLIVILLSVLAVTFFAYLTFTRPEKPPKSNICISVSALLLGISLFAELIFKKNVTIVSWQSVLLNILSVLMIAYLVSLFLKPLFNLKIPKIFSAITVLYMIIRMICSFTAISKLALISDNILLIFSYCAVLLFFLNYTKLYNGAETDTIFKKILSSGLASAVLCFTYSIPNFLINIISNQVYYHSSIFTNITVLFLGIYILSFSLSYFSKKNI